MRMEMTVAKLAVSLVLFSSMAMAALVACHPKEAPVIESAHSSASAEDQRGATLRPEEYEVYSALFRNRLARGPLPTVSDRTVASDQSVDSLRNILPADVQAETSEDYLSKNRSTSSIADHFNLPAGEVVLIDDRELTSVLQTGRWDDFFRKHPKDRSFTRLSRVGLNRRANQALLQQLFFGGPGVFNAVYVLLEKDSSGWKVKKEFGHMMS